MAVNYPNSDLLISAGQIKQFPALPLPQAVFSGRSNVGKSSLINCLLGRKSLARVSSTPGKTVTVNFYRVDNKAVFVDLPGYGFAKRSGDSQRQWSELTDGFFTKNKNIDLLKIAVQLVDIEVGPTKDDLMMIDYLVRTGIKFIVVASKADKPNKTNRTIALDKLRSCELIPADTPIIPFSSKSGEGREELRRILADAMGIS
ncbi:MAG: ribosome biogenesis GTP-binding protein YihA/YsxC [Clostridia bacterium]|nr:ribosome biogenesis GTP-binding protein YihA/YsxC [Clostridia bacterium]